MEAGESLGLPAFYDAILIPPLFSRSGQRWVL